MRLTFAHTGTFVVSLLALYACASGKASENSSGFGGATTTQPGSGGATNTTTGNGGSTATGNGGSTATGNGGAATGGAATGGAATGGAPCTSAKLATWTSYAACYASQAEMTTTYNNWKTTYFVDCGTQAYIKANVSESGAYVDRVVSEGIAYGMLAAANLSKSEDFSKLWAFYKARLKSNGLMPWKYPLACTGNPLYNDTNSATDAELDAAIALLVAAKNFSNSTYLTDAKALIAAIKSGETSTNCAGGRYLIKASDGSWAGCSNLNPSYFAPGYYRVFGKVTNDSTFWDKMATDALSLLAVWQGKMNGQVPDWGRDDGSLGDGDPAHKSTYDSEACRSPWRIAVDYGWHQKADAKTYLTTMYNGILKQGRPYAATTEQQHTSAYVGGYATVGTGIDQATADLYFSDWYLQRNLPGDIGANTYYANTLKLLYMITMGGRFDNGQ